MGFHEIQGSFWDYAPEYDALVVTLNTIVKNNGALTMGAGIAKQFVKEYPNIPFIFGEMTKEMYKYSDEPYPLCTMLDNGKYVIGIHTKLHWKNESPLWLVHRSISSMVSLVNSLNIKKVLMTRPGCGHGGRNWKMEIKPILNELLDERFTVCHI
jgi:hypothetical protein